MVPSGSGFMCTLMREPAGAVRDPDDSLWHSQAACNAVVLPQHHWNTTRAAGDEVRLVFALKVGSASLHRAAGFVGRTC